MALEMRKAGATYAHIAQVLNITETAARKAVLRALARLNEKVSESAEEVRRLELERLDALLAALWGKAQAGDGAAIDRVLRIMERRARLLGLDAPERIEQSGQVLVVVDE